MRSGGGGRLTRYAALQHALDEARFGAARTLNLRASLPTAADAAARTEAWLRERQASGGGQVLIITGRGRHSPGGVSVVRERVARLLSSLRRRGVVEGVEEHTPGSFVVRLAPLSALRNAPARRREGARGSPASPAAPAALAALEPATLALLRRAALRALEDLGARDPERFVEAEMIAQLSHLARAIPETRDREARLRAALAALVAEYDER